MTYCTSIQENARAYYLSLTCLTTFLVLDIRLFNLRICVLLCLLWPYHFGFLFVRAAASILVWQTSYIYSTHLDSVPAVCTTSAKKGPWPHGTRSQEAIEPMDSDSGCSVPCCDGGDSITTQHTSPATIPTEKDLKLCGPWFNRLLIGTPGLDSAKSSLLQGWERRCTVKSGCPGRYCME